MLWKKIHPEQVVVEMTEEYGIFALNLLPNYELKSRLLSYGDTLEVLEPKEFREEMKTLIENLSKLYKVL